METDQTKAYRKPREGQKPRLKFKDCLVTEYSLALKDQSFLLKLSAGYMRSTNIGELSFLCSEPHLDVHPQTHSH